MQIFQIYTESCIILRKKKRQREKRGLESTKTDYNSKFHKQVIMIDQNRGHLRVTVAMLTFGEFLQDTKKFSVATAN